MIFILNGATFASTIGNIPNISNYIGSVGTGGTGGTTDPVDVVLTFNYSPAAATLTLTYNDGTSNQTKTDTGNGTYQLTVKSGTSINWTLSATGYTTKNGTITMPAWNKSETVNLVSAGTDGDDSGTVTYIITYKYQSGGVDIKTATTETVAAGTSKTFSTSNAPTIDGYTVSSVSPTSATINANTTVIYSYTAVASGSYGPNLLSNGELNEGQTLSSSSCTMTANANVYTYMYVPVEAGATYYGLNFKRCWWLDADKASLETYNGKNTSPQWTATAPSGAAYWCGCAYYTEQDLATASFAQVLS